MAWTSSELIITKGRHKELSQHSVRMKKDEHGKFYEKNDKGMHTALEKSEKWYYKGTYICHPNYLEE